MARKQDQDKADEGTQAVAPVVAKSAVKNAYQLAGVWYAANGRPLTDVEAQQAHRARDKEQAAARERALLGGVE